MGEYTEPIKWGLIYTSLDSGHSQNSLVRVYDVEREARAEADRLNANTMYEPEAGIGEYYDVIKLGIGSTAVATVFTTEYTTGTEQAISITRHVKENI